MKATPRERVWLTQTLLLTACLCLLSLLALPDLSSPEEEEESPPRRTPLVDLCAWFPYPKVTRLVPDPRPPRLEHYFPGVLQCRWLSRNGRARLEISAVRPNRGDTLEEESRIARDAYSSPGVTGKVSPAGIGEESMMVVDTESDTPAVGISARDGLVSITVLYKAPREPEQLIAGAKEAAVELLRILPHKGY
ncbi:hypothetical protein [Thermomonospora sp. CIF 1]|uniref:hypothetical protein n=1 Tax=Thermomonospora sp. CIF 1 TaxID=1916083 RepID=UPI000CB1CCDA|nr:hypothetical protein [Thermomonospora sp. CIF 1]PKK14354.1 MAG: hypothetical protein BUE48_012350 [Thermomonospora sp. CIF 1]